MTQFACHFFHLNTWNWNVQSKYTKTRIKTKEPIKTKSGRRFICISINKWIATTLYSLLFFSSFNGTMNYQSDFQNRHICTNVRLPFRSVRSFGHWKSEWHDFSSLRPLMHFKMYTQSIIRRILELIYYKYAHRMVKLFLRCSQFDDMQAHSSFVCDDNGKWLKSPAKYVHCVVTWL